MAAVDNTWLNPFAWSVFLVIRLHYSFLPPLPRTLPLFFSHGTAFIRFCSQVVFTFSQTSIGCLGQHTLLLFQRKGLARTWYGLHCTSLDTLH